MTDIEYYKLQLSKLKNKENITVKFWDYDGNETNCMTLNNELLDLLVKFIAKEEQK